jgi:hypothetical protein
LYFYTIENNNGKLMRGKFLKVDLKKIIMKKIILITAILTHTISGFSQLTPEFEFQLYAEDFLGNRDTITIGYDSRAAEYDTINTQFGEVDITNTPFDSTFEMRASNFNSNTGNFYQFLQSKKTIAKWSCQGIFPYFDNYFTEVYISIRSKNLPIRLEWDVTQFQDTCNDALAFSEFYQWGSLWLFRENVPHYDMKTNGYAVIYNNINPNDPNNIYQAPIQGGGTGDVYGITLNIGSEKAIVANTSNIKTHLTAKTFPNPATHQLHIEIPEVFREAETFRVFNANGQLVKSESVSQYQMTTEVGTLANGLYFYTIENKKGELIRGKFLKVE